MKSKTIDAAELPDQLDDVLNEIARQDVSYILARSGRPDAVLVSYDEFMRWQQSDEQAFMERFDAMLRRLDAHNNRYSEEEIAADVAEAIAEVRGQR